MVKVLIIEDEGIVALDLHLRLQALGYQVVGMANSVTEALQTVERLATTPQKPNLALIDINLGDGGDGTEAGQVIRDRLVIPILYLTAYDDPVTLARAEVTGPAGYLFKPFTTQSLAQAIAAALQPRQQAIATRASQNGASSVT